MLQQNLTTHRTNNTTSVNCQARLRLQPRGCSAQLAVVPSRRIYSRHSGAVYISSGPLIRTPSNAATAYDSCISAQHRPTTRTYVHSSRKGAAATVYVDRPHISSSQNNHRQNSYVHFNSSSRFRCSGRFVSGPRRIVPQMVEGHQCHRVGAAHRRLLLGKAFHASSPNGRFIDGAAAITGKLLTRIEVHGKNLFYFFSGSSSSSGGAAGSSAAAGSNIGNNIFLTSADIDPLADPDDSASDDLIIPAAAAAAAAGSPVVPPRTPAKSSGTSSAIRSTDPGPHVHRANPASGTPGILRSAGSAAAAALAGTGNHSNITNSDNNNDVVVHIHFGMSGAFRTALMPGPAPTPTTRLRLEHQASGLMAHLSAMTVAHGGPGFYQEKVSKLGPDPLRPDDDPERFWSRVNSSKKPIGLLLMDQSAVAGVGNIYRAEILYKSRLHPEQPGYSLTRQQFDTLWQHCVECLQRGFTSGSILTVDPEDARILGKPWTRRYIYNQRSCGRCKGPVKSWGMAGRTVYCCEACQPLQLNLVAAAAAAPASKKSRSRKTAASSSSDGEGAAPAAAAAAAEIVLSPQRLKSMAAAKQAKEFVSHCAPDDPSDLQPTKMTCAQLRQQLISLNLNTRGNKPDLVARLEQALVWAAATDQSLGRNQAAAAAAAGGGGSSGSEDEVDRAEDKLAENLSVPAAKRRRRPSATATAAAAAAGSSDEPATPSPPKRRRKTTAAAAAASIGEGDTAAMASATAAAAEKAAAGENRAVEHVALHADEVTEALMFKSQQQRSGARRSRSKTAM